MKKLKFLCLLLCLAMVLSSFSACIMIGDGIMEEEESNENAETDETENTEDETSESDDAQKEEETPKLVLPAVLITVGAQAFKIIL